jgi:hypothetical protein
MKVTFNGQVNDARIGPTIDVKGWTGYYFFFGFTVDRSLLIVHRLLVITGLVAVTLTLTLT